MLLSSRARTTLGVAAALVFQGCAPADAGSGAAVGAGAADGGDDPIALRTRYPAYANTAKYLYGVDPSEAGVTVEKLGAFDCIGGVGQDPTMTDLAVDATGELWGVSAGHVHRIVVEGGVARCASTLAITNAADPKNVSFFGLTFAPAGVIDDARETLVAGNTAGELWAVDTASGAVTPHGRFGAVPKDDGRGHAYPLDPAVTGDTVGSPWELSGDVVFLANAGAPIGFATLRDCKAPPSSLDCDGTDTLVEIDMAKLKSETLDPIVRRVVGAVVPRPGCADGDSPKGYGGMYGIAAWSDQVYGFSKSGAVVAIDNGDGSACLVMQRKTPWYGAGVTTTAPVIQPAR